MDLGTLGGNLQKEVSDEEEEAPWPEHPGGDLRRLLLLRLLLLDYYCHHDSYY